MSILPQTSPHAKLAFTSVFTLAKKSKGTPNASWTPSAFRLWVLFLAAIICWILIIVLQLLLVRSQRDGGIIFATSTNEIPISRSFLYLYLPTIIALVYSIFWSWIDLQVKRLEPYHQLSKPGGACGKDSLLLQYPFDFIPFVPISALKNRHWAVFWASAAVVVVTWLLVPLQAAIFASETIFKSEDLGFHLSAKYVPASEQNQTLTSRYIQSAHGIIWLNETLPPYMSRDYALTPFEPQQLSKPQPNETWTATTTLYSVDVECEAQNETFVNEYGREYYNSTIGCQYPVDADGLGNNTIGDDSYHVGQTSLYKYKEFSSNFVGYYLTGWYRYSSIYSLEGMGYCDNRITLAQNRPFLATFARNKKRKEDPAPKVSQILCVPSYYKQEVDATVDAQTRIPMNVTAKGIKQKLPADIWDSYFFEYQMNRGSLLEKQLRGTLPLRYWPDQLGQVSTSQLTLYDGSNALPPMAGLAFGARNQSLENLLKPEVLKDSYERAYRIIFSRLMVEILDQSFSKTSSLDGTKKYATGAITLVPAFTYVVEGLLGFISVCAIALSIVSIRRTWSLHSDPATISGVMSLVADNSNLLEKLSHLDCEAPEYYEQYLRDKKFKLEHSQHGNCIVEADDNPFIRVNPDVVQIPEPVRPRQFRSYMFGPFIMLHIALVVTLGVLFTKGKKDNGFARPSNNAIVRQLVENYIPTALATLIEPIWILINRLLCMLQPLEELRDGRAVPKNSIDANYSSLPPQLVIFKALRSAHFKLAAVCLMALLANVLAVAFAGMFNEQAVLIQRTAELYPPFAAKFVAINGSVGPTIDSYGALFGFEPSGAYSGGLGTDLFLAADSHYTAGTPLPAWVDESFMYIPFTDSNNIDENIEGLQAQTEAFSASLDCKELPPGDYHAEASVIPLMRTASNSSFVMTMPDEMGHRFTCGLHINVPQYGNIGPVDNEGGPLADCYSGANALELVLHLTAGENATQEEKNFCARTTFLLYARHPDAPCSKNIVFNASNALVMGCSSRLVTATANVFVDREGRVKNASQVEVLSEFSKAFLGQHFSNDVSNLLDQGNKYLFRFNGGIWHNDTNASDMVNYFISKQQNDRLLDPESPLPTFEDVTKRLYPVYSSLFAIWLGVSKEKLLIPSVPGSVPPVIGRTTESHIRIFLSFPLFVIAEVILGIYAIVAFCIWFRRPGRFLPRMPTTISAVIALFAASTAVLDMEGTSHFKKNERKEHLEDLGYTYGYGTFVGVDGNLHIGVEKEPLVKTQPIPGVVKKVRTGLTKTNTGLGGWSKKMQKRFMFERQNSG